MDSWVVIAVYGRDNTDNRGWLWLSVVSRVGKLHLTGPPTSLLRTLEHDVADVILHVVLATSPKLDTGMSD